jgi:hypothetical protein
LAESLLVILCGKCHKINNLRIEFLDITFHNKNQNQHISMFSDNKISLDDFYIQINPENIYSILTSISNPERRVSLHLRYLKDYPCIFTTCCHSEHCFQCRLKPYHHNKKCIEMNLSELDNSIVTCPDCSIQLIKGDGCNHVSCVCGNSFDWEKEKELFERCRVFETKYPETFEKCIEILCSENEDIIYAKSWRKKHQIQINTRLYEWFKRKYTPYPSKVCANLYNERTELTFGIKKAIKIWYHSHTSYVDKYITQKTTNTRSIFEVFFPNIKDRLSGLYNIRCYSNQSLLKESIYLWVTENPKLYKNGILELKIQQTLSFLYLYGRYGPKEIGINPFIGESWDIIRSNPSLTYTNDNRTVERKGDVSCYPAIFSTEINDTNTRISIKLDHLPTSNNYFSFGISTDLMEHSYSDGVGKSFNS